MSTLQQKNSVNVNSPGREKQWPQSGFSEEPAGKVHPLGQKPGLARVPAGCPHPSPFWENLCVI